MSEPGHDVVVIGGGPAGMAAAVRAAEVGARVLVVDEGRRGGGQIWRHSRPGDHAHRKLPAVAKRWLRRFDRLAEDGRIRTLFGASVVSGQASDSGCRLLVQHADAAHEVRTRAVILAPGARERFLPFPGWTVPGVMGVGGAQAMLKHGLQVRDRRVVVAGTGPLLLAAAAALAGAGARVVAVAEQASFGSVAGFAMRLPPSRMLHAAVLRAAVPRARYLLGTWVSRVVGTERVEAAVLTDGARTRTIPCEIVCSGYALVPATELGRLFGCALDHHAVAVDTLQRTTVPGVYCAGEAAGIAGVDSAVVQGEIAGLAAAGREPPAGLLAERQRHARFARRMDEAFALRPELRDLPEADTIVCRCEDVRHGELGGFTCAAEAKLVTRAGMGACQARVCGPAQRFLYGWGPDSIRPPVLPARVSTMMKANASAATQGDE